jgi:predicted  nucleic acid-binding Zn-ribbon protein
VDVDFENLINLQRLDTEIRRLSAFLNNIPSQIAEIDKKINDSAQIVDKAKENLALNQKKRRSLEDEVNEVKVKTSKYKVQLNEIKTNVEYTSLLKEIEVAQQKIDQLEEEIISLMLSSDDIEKEIKQATEKHCQEETKLSKEKETINQKKQELEIQIKELTQEKEKLLNQIPLSQSKLYSELSEKKNGVALSPVKGEFCSMCHMRVRPQVLNELRVEKEIIFCENCGRILYWLKKSA